MVISLSLISYFIYIDIHYTPELDCTFRHDLQRGVRRFMGSHTLALSTRDPPSQHPC